ncbi:unnamed protein product [Sphagnum jensenii]|uniref:Uncharacterized protein n=1 Tax=Sphagnum jensenii TaxID=128206 RepID=A0ABP1BS57_9BRYO
MATTLHERRERGFKCNTAAVLRSNGKQRNGNTAGIRSQAKKRRRRCPLQYISSKSIIHWDSELLEPNVYLLRKPSKTNSETRPLGWVSSKNVI